MNTAGVVFAEDPDTGWLYAYRSYHPKKAKTPRQHKDAILRGEPRMPFCVGGASSENEWRGDYQHAGFPISQPSISDVELGIDKVYSVVNRGGLFIFDDLVELIKEFNNYSRELDSEGNPTDKIADKAKYHRLDAVRYIISEIRRDLAPMRITSHMKTA